MWFAVYRPNFLKGYSLVKLFLSVCHQYMILHTLCLQVGVPGIILRCLEHMESKDKARPVAFLAKMTAYRPLAVQLLGKGLLDPRRMKSLLDGSCPGEAVLDVLMIVSDLARMDKVNSLLGIHS